jgi:hypothetical protein
MRAMKPLMNARRCLVVLLLVGLFLLLVVTAIGCAPRQADPTGSENVSQDGASSDEGLDSDPAPTVDNPYIGSFTWAADTECAVCHQGEGASFTEAAMPAFTHAAHEVDCMDCHTDTTALTKAHEGKDGSSKVPTRLRTTRIDEEVCLSCHESDHQSKEALVVKTVASNALVDENGKTVNPHELPANDDHASIRCGTCHNMHSDEDLAARSKKNCLTCHHEDVFECGTCHEQ